MISWDMASLLALMVQATPLETRPTPKKRFQTFSKDLASTSKVAISVLTTLQLWSLQARSLLLLGQVQGLTSMYLPLAMQKAWQAVR